MVTLHVTLAGNLLPCTEWVADFLGESFSMFLFHLRYSGANPTPDVDFCHLLLDVWWPANCGWMVGSLFYVTA
jgi:hypothetical protein